MGLDAQANSLSKAGVATNLDEVLLASTARPTKRRRLVKASECVQSTQTVLKVQVAGAAASAWTTANGVAEDLLLQLPSSDNLKPGPPVQNEEAKAPTDDASSNKAPAGIDEDEEATAEQRTNDAVCMNCDDGGEILLCDGPCMRSFHATEECNVLKVPEELFEVLQTSRDQFLCPMCLAGQHRCFSCGNLGCSQARDGIPRDVFRCAVATCGRFYHSECVGKSQDQAEADPFACPLHECRKCKREEDQPGRELVPCRRCPTAYHPDCAPHSLLQGPIKRIWICSGGVDEDNGIAQSLLYCEKHDIPEDQDTPLFKQDVVPATLLAKWSLATARQNPDLSWSRQQLKNKAVKAQQSNDVMSIGTRDCVARLSNAALGSGMIQSPLDAKLPAKPPKVTVSRLAAAPAPESETCGQQPLADEQGLCMPALKSKPCLPKQLLWEHSRNAAKKLLAVLPEPADERPLFSETVNKHPFNEDTRHAGVGLSLPATITDSSQPNRPAADARLSIEFEAQAAALGSAQQAADETSSILTVLDLCGPGGEEADCEREETWTEDAQHAIAAACLNAANDIITFKDVEAAARKPPPYDRFLKKTVDEARLAAYKDNVRLVDMDRRQLHHLTDAAVREISADEDRMRTILAPLLQSKRYTSYGRHFTKGPQMEAVVVRLLDYLRPHDTVVDFSCGANEFVPLLKERALKSGIEIFGRAYDIITGRHFEDLIIKSWFEVLPGELPHGDQLVIGLNPPFGKDGTLANQFINHAAKHWPRIIILIVPPATIVPDNYLVQYENTRIMSDKAFYIPGGDKHCQSWNVVTPAVRVLVRKDAVPDLFNDHSGWSTRHLQPLASSFVSSMPIMPMPGPPAVQGFAFPMPVMMTGPWPPMPMGQI